MKGSPKMSSGITNPTASDTIDKVLANTAQLLRLLREAGLTDEARQRVINDPEFRTRLVMFWNDNQTIDTTTTAEQAAEIMGTNFHGISALEQHMGVNLSARSKKLFQIVPFNVELLQSCCETHVLVACGALSFMDVWGQQSELFDREFDPINNDEDCIATDCKMWFGTPEEEWARRPIKAGWQLVRKQLVGFATGKTWEEQKELLESDEQVPSASVLAQVILIHYLETLSGSKPERLFEKVVARSSDTTPYDTQVHLGYFDQDGLVVAGWDDDRWSWCGLASSLKPS